MFIADTDIATPYDKAYAYKMSWRHEAAIAINSERVVHRFIGDDGVFMQMKYLDMIDDDVFENCLDDLIGDRSSDDNPLRSIAEANKIFQTGSQDHTKERLEAMLLCPEFNYDVIGNEFDIPGSTVRMFEKLFFNIRDDQGRLKGNTGLLMYAVLKGAVAFTARAGREAEESHPMHWRILAFEGGYKRLYADWNWKPKGDLEAMNIVDVSADLMRSTYSSLNRMLRFNPNVSGQVLAQMLTTLTQQFADMRKSGILSDSDKIDPNAMILEVIKLLAPERMLETEEKIKLVQVDLDTKLAAVLAKEGRGKPDEQPQAFRHIDSQLNKGVSDNV